MIHATSRPTVPTTLLLALLLAVTALVAGAALVSAETVIYSSATGTPASFAKKCERADGVLVEEEGANGGIAKSTCYTDGNIKSECNWGTMICKQTFPDLVPGIEGGGVGGPVDGELLDDTPHRPTVGDVAAPSTGGGVFDRAP
jgi:hypothetical protein